MHGEIWMDVYTDFPERLIPGKVLYLGRERKPKTIRSFQLSGKRGLVSFSGIATPEQANILKNQLVYAKTGHLPRLPDGAYYHHDLIGMTVLDENEREIGRLTEILQTGSNDVYIVADVCDEGKEILIPAIKSVIIKVDITAGKMVVRLQEWM